MNRAERRRIQKLKVKTKVKLVDLTKFAVIAPPITGQSEDACYAKSLSSCAGKISREHYISETVLKHFPKIPAKGIPWLTHVESDISPNALTTRCLCQKHNSVLSPLDDFADKIFTQLKTFWKGDQAIVRANGKTFELWMLKTLFGLIATNKIEHKNKKFSTKDLDSSWTEVLFGLKEFPNEMGLYLSYAAGDRIDIGNTLTVAPAFLDDKLVGLELHLGGWRFLLIITKKEIAFNPKSKRFDSLLYRPKEINIAESAGKICFEW